MLTPEEYERRRAGYIKEGKGTPPPGAEPKDSAHADTAARDRFMSPSSEMIFDTPYC